MIKYQKASDSKGNIIDISLVTKESRNSEFFCLGCGAEMVPALGDKREHYFRHKGSDNSCDKDRYIHRYAELCIKEAFDSSDHFYVPFYPKNKCPNLESCKLHEIFFLSQCNGVLEQFDLKKWFDTCELERKYGDFIADILLTSSKNSSLPPVFIEIYHTSPCSKDKINSGVHIVELKVDEEADVDRFLDPLRFKNSKCVFHNFKESSFVSNLYQILKFSYRQRLNKGETKFEDNSFNCSDENLMKKEANSLFCLLAPVKLNTTNNQSLKELAHLIAVRKGIEKECRFCTSHFFQKIVVHNISRCWNGGLPKPLPDYPCENFQLNEVELDRMLEKKKGNFLLLE